MVNILQHAYALDVYSDRYGYVLFRIEQPINCRNLLKMITCARINDACSVVDVERLQLDCLQKDTVADQQLRSFGPEGLAC
jgi:hypothetical protein